MPRRRISQVIVVVALMCLLLAPARQAHAQDLDTIAGELGLADLDGIQHAVSRTYAANIKTAVDNATSATPVSTGDSPQMMLALVARFDTDDHATKGAGTIKDRLVKRFTDQPAGGTFIITSIPSLGDTGWTFSQVNAGNPDALVIDGYIAQQGRWVILSIAVGYGDVSASARNLAEFALSSRSGVGDVVYDVSGTSQGGIWDKLPGNDRGAASILAGTLPIYDNEIVMPASADDKG